MNTTQLECFLAVADFLNFSRAAQQLRLTQPAVSHQVKTLEDELGVALFHRTSKKVRLTQEGHMFLQYAGKIVQLSNLSRVRVKGCYQARPMRLGIGCRSSADLRLLRPALERMRLEEERILPLLRLIPLSALDNLLTEGDIQVLCTFQETAPQNSVYRELLRCPVVMVCREDHPLAQAQTVTVEQLKADGPLIAAYRPPLCPPSVFSIQGQILTAKPPEQVIFCENQEVLSTLVQTGYAFSVAADFPQLRSSDLRYIPVEGSSPLSFGVAYLPGNRSQTLRRLLSILEQTVTVAPNPGI